MEESLRVLIIEDSSDDAELVVLQLSRRGLKVQSERVDSPQALTAALARSSWDVIIADYNLPGFDGLAALRIVKQYDLDVPFVIVSGAIGDETAVQAMKAGAHDYVSKSNLTRLGAAVSRELAEAKVRRERRQAVSELHRLAQRSALLSEASGRLAASLDFEETLATAAHVPLHEAADWCLITFAELGPRLLTAIGHVDSALEDRAQERLDNLDLDPLAERGAARVIRTRQYEWLTPDAALVGSAADAPAAAALVRELGFDSGLCLPLVARGRSLGAMTLVRASPRQRLSLENLDFATELAARAGMALDNSALYRQAREAIQTRDEFLSIASHELNTPLATLTLQLDELLRFLRSNPSGAGVAERVLGGMVRSRRQVQRLTRQVESLLDVTRISEDRFQLHRGRVDLAAVVREVIDQSGLELSRSGCEVRVQADDRVLGRWDPGRIAQVVASLLSNACKYGAGRPVDIRVEAQGNVARLTVSDQGIGIAPADLDRIFQRFERAVSSQHYGGLGLGLYIARHILQAHGGTIRVASAPGRGATFKVELPLESALAEEGELPRGSQQPG